MLTFPIDTVEPGEIPAFSGIFASYHIDPSRLSRMVRFVCYRYDPKCTEIVDISEEKRKTARAEEKSGYTCPLIDKSMVNDAGEFVPSEELSVLMSVTTDFFALLNNPRWEGICTMRAVIAEGYEHMRRPINPDMDLDAQLKLSDFKGRLAERNKSLLDDVDAQVAKFSAGSPVAAIAAEIELSRMKVRRASTSPEGHLRDRDD